MQKNAIASPDDPSLNRNDTIIGDWGCYFRSLEAIAEVHTGKNLTAEQIIEARRVLTDVLRTSLGGPVLSRSRLEVGETPPVVVHAFSIFNINVRAVRFDTKPDEYDYVIRRYYRLALRDVLNEDRTVKHKKGYWGTHFLLVEKDETTIIFDPDSHASNLYINQDGSLKADSDDFSYEVSYRYIEITVL